MLTSDQINDLHRLYWSEHWPMSSADYSLRLPGHQRALVRKDLRLQFEGTSTACRTAMPASGLQ
jgi:hypothetical protein